MFHHYETIRRLSPPQKVLGQSYLQDADFTGHIIVHLSVQHAPGSGHVGVQLFIQLFPGRWRQLSAAVVVVPSAPAPPSTPPIAVGGVSAAEPPSAATCKVVVSPALRATATPATPSAAASPIIASPARSEKKQKCITKFTQSTVCAKERNSLFSYVTRETF
jgi:hypothetical protein